MYSTRRPSTRKPYTKKPKHSIGILRHNIGWPRHSNTRPRYSSRDIAPEDPDKALKNLGIIPEDPIRDNPAAAEDHGIALQNLVIEVDKGKVVRKKANGHSIVAENPEIEDLVAVKDPDIASENWMPEDPALEDFLIVKDLAIKDELCREVVEGQKLLKQVVSLFFFYKVFCLLFSSSKSYTISITWLSLFFISALSSIFTLRKQKPLSSK